MIQQGKFHKSELTKKITGRLLGQGLLISEGEFWRRQRRLAQPAFHRSRISEYAVTMVESAGRSRPRMAQRRTARHGRGDDGADAEHRGADAFRDHAGRGPAAGGPRDDLPDALSAQPAEIAAANSGNLADAAQPPRARANARSWIRSSTRSSRTARARAATRTQRNDLLSMLMGAMDEDGSQMTRQQLRDETMTLFIAGHETTAQMLAWTWYLLSENPDGGTAERGIAQACWAGALRKRRISAKLPYLQAVMNESLRLYPPAYIMARTSIEPCEIGGYNFRRERRC